MATSRRKPAIPPLRTLELRELQLLFSNIRERLDQVDQALATVGAASAATSTSATTASSASTAISAGTADSLSASRDFDLAGVTTDGPHAFDGTGNVTIEILEIPLALLEQDGATVAQVLAWDGSGGWTPVTLLDPVGPIDHGALLGLGDDDHPHYLNETRADALYSAIGHVHDLADVTGLSAALAGVLANPLQDYGDLIVGQSGGGAGRLPVGAEGQVLRVVAGLPAWDDESAGGGGMANPMTSFGDLIFGQSAGSPARLAVGAEGQVLRVVSGLPAWDDETAGGGGGGMTNPMLDYGDMIVGQSAGGPARLAPGTDGQVLTMTAGLPAWEAGGADPWTYLVLGSDHTTTSTSSGDVSALQFTPDANSVYVIEAHLMISTTNTAAGARPGFLFNSGAAMGTVWIVVGQLSGSVLNRFGNYLDGDNSRSNHVYAAAGSLGSTEPWPSTINAILESGGSPNAAGVTLAGETATTVTYSILAGSFLRYRKIA